MEKQPTKLLSNLIERGHHFLTLIQIIEKQVGFGGSIAGMILTRTPLMSSSINDWRAECLILLSNFGSKQGYLESFKEATRGDSKRSIIAGVKILESLRRSQLQPDSPPVEIELVERICGNFHRIAQQLRQRHGNRPTLTIQDEYDVQDLFHALLCLDFGDIRPEEWTPSYAGKSSRVDFLLKEERIIVEIKKTRLSLTTGLIGDQLIEDIARYGRHPDCGALLCFIYDPEGLIANPRGLEADLAREEPFPVRVFIRPM